MYLTVLESYLSMIEKIILLISDQRLRQLYHELLISENVEIIPAYNLENALLIESIDNISITILYPDDIESKSIERFLQVHQKIEKLSKVKMIILTSDPDQYASIVSVDRIIINIIHLNPDEVVKRVKIMLPGRDRRFIA